MKQPITFLFFAVNLWILAMMPPLAGAEEDIGDVLRPTLVTSEMLKSKIAETEAAPDLPAEAKTKLIELYRKALSNLEETKATAERAAAFQKATETAPAQTRVIREQEEAAKGTDPLATLGVSLENPLEQLERQLQKVRADLAAVDARRADFERRLADEENRPAMIRQRLAEGTQQQEEIAAALRIPPDADEKPALTQARRWVLENRNAALSAEIRMLNQEPLSQPMRLDLLKAQRDQGAGKVARIGARVKVLSELVNSKRQREAEQAQTEAEKTQRETAGLDPLLIRLADRNAELTGDLAAMAVRLDELHREQARTKKLVEQIAADHNEAQTTLETTGLTEGLGQVLVEARESLPDLQMYARSARALDQEIAAAAVRRLRHRKEARRIGDLSQTIATLETQLTVDKTPELSDRLRDLVEQRQILLTKALETDEFYLNRLREVNATERRLLEVARVYDDFLSEHLLWLGSADPTRLQDLQRLPDEARQLLSPAIWSGPARALIDQVAQSPAAWLALLLAVVLLWKHRALIAAIEETSAQLGKPTTDSFSYSLRALVLTLIAAAPLPLLLAVPGWQLQVAAQGTGLSQALGVSLFRVALLFYFLRALRLMCMPRGLAAAHFRWPESNLCLLRVELGRLTWIFVPTMLVVRLALDMNPAETGGAIARLFYIAGFGVLALFFYRVLHPKGGVLAYLRLRRETGVLVRTNKLWFPLLLAFPLGLAVLAQTGYLYSATALSLMFLPTLLMVFGLVVLHALALRWLLVARRRLAYEAAMERRQATLEAKQAGELEAGDEEGGALQVEEPEVDLEALSDDSRELVTLAVILTGLVGLYLIWSPVLPALRIFDDVTLWYHTVTVDGEDKRLPITLADLGLALIYAIGIGVLAKRLPAVLEIIMLQRFDMSSGSRYAVTTLTNYAIIAVGVLLVLNTIGAQWSQLQWLVAALSVGIGFGLQEIVANFISGLIILFERPIRVGDIVTVGDTDGVVTRIRIRATTIRNWDRKELLVPNKEFITGRLLNWTLSDKMTRVVVVVGVVYGSDVDKALDLMREAAEENEHVLDDPQPVLSFESFDDNSLRLILRAYLGSIDYRIPTTTELHKVINRKFNEAGIVIAFPQRDMHLSTFDPLRISIEDVRQEKPEGGNAE